MASISPEGAALLLLAEQWERRATLLEHERAEAEPSAGRTLDPELATEAATLRRCARDIRRALGAIPDCSHERLELERRGVYRCAECQARLTRATQLDL